MFEQSRLVVAVVLMISLLMALLVVNQYGGLNFVFGIFSGDRNVNQAEGSMQLAVEACKREVRSAVGPNLLQMDVDGLSTRYDESGQRYFVFVDIMVAGQERVPIYVECEVSALTQAISRVRVNGPPRGFNLF